MYSTMIKITTVLAALLLSLPTTQGTSIAKLVSRTNDGHQPAHKGDWKHTDGWRDEWRDSHRPDSDSGKGWEKNPGWKEGKGKGKGKDGHGKGNGKDGGKNPNGKDPNTKDPSGKDPNDKDPTGKDPDGKDPTGKDPVKVVIPDPTGPDPNAEVITPEIIQLIIDNEANAPKPDFVDFGSDQDDTFVPIPADLPEHYCLYEGLNDPGSFNVSAISAPRPDGVVDADTCASYYQQYIDYRRSLHEKRTFAGTSGNGFPNRWRRGSVVSVCVEKNFDWRVTYNGQDLRASQVIAAATFRALSLWNNGIAEGSAGLDPRFVQFEFTTECNRAVYRVKSLDYPKPDRPNVLADCEYPPSAVETVQKILNVYNTAFQDNYQNVLTTIQSHELGHALGIAHENCETLDPAQPCISVAAGVSGSLMSASIGNSYIEEFTGPLAEDIAGVNRYYSRAGGPNSPLGIVLWYPFEGPFTG
jgi:hypothetical protein